MIITITGPRSIGKSSVSKILAEKLKLNYVSSDAIGEKALEKEGGLDRAIKSGVVKDFIRKNGYNLILNEYKRNNFVFDLSGGSISSIEFEKASEEVRNIAKIRSLVIGLLPFKDEDKSIKLLFEREEKREHFKEMDKKELRDKVIRNYEKFPKIFKDFCDVVIYTENKKPFEVADEIIIKLNKLSA